MCRPGMEDFMDRDFPETEGDVVNDIMDSKVFRDFLGPDKKPFLQASGLKGRRYIFSLCMDGFNPYHMKEAGKKASTGAMYMVCLNLPPEIRYDFENIYLVGIIPGPSEPSLTEINHLLEPLIKDLLLFWHPGVFYASTPRYPLGRTVLCALIPLICDLPASRQMGGLHPTPVGTSAPCVICN